MIPGEATIQYNVLPWLKITIKLTPIPRIFFLRKYPHIADICLNLYTPFTFFITMYWPNIISVHCRTEWYLIHHNTNYKTQDISIYNLWKNISRISVEYYTNIDFCWGEYVIIFFKQKTYSPSVRGEYVFCLKNIITYSPNNKSLYLFYYFYFPMITMHRIIK